MRHVCIAVTLFVALFAGTSQPIRGQDAAETATERLDWFVGDWTYDAIDGRTTCEMLGDYIVHCESAWTTDDGDEVEAVFITRYDAVEDTYWGYRFYNGGYADVARAWVDGDDWTFVYEGRDGALIRFSATASNDTWTYAWHRSEQGGEWVETSRGSMTKG